MDPFKAFLRSLSAIRRSLLVSLCRHNTGSPSVHQGLEHASNCKRPSRAHCSTQARTRAKVRACNADNVCLLSKGQTNRIYMQCIDGLNWAKIMEQGLHSSGALKCNSSYTRRTLRQTEQMTGVMTSQQHQFRSGCLLRTSCKLCTRQKQPDTCPCQNYFSRDLQIRHV